MRSAPLVRCNSTRRRHRLIRVRCCQPSEHPQITGFFGNWKSSAIKVQIFDTEGALIGCEVHCKPYGSAHRMTWFVSWMCRLSISRREEVCEIEKTFTYNEHCMSCGRHLVISLITNDTKDAAMGYFLLYKDALEHRFFPDSEGTFLPKGQTEQGKITSEGNRL